MIVTMFIFAVQDGISSHLAERYNTITVVMIRYWAFAGFVLLYSLFRYKSISKVAKTKKPFLQIARSVILVLEIITTVIAFVRLGLVQSHAIFACFPLIATALSVPILHETVGWRRWTAVGIGFLGVLIILRPDGNIAVWDALIPLFSAGLFALYHVLTRLASRSDAPETSFFWTGIAGAVSISCIGPFFWNPMVGEDWYWMGALCVTSIVGHFLLILALTLSEASKLQPFTYFQLLFAGLIGVMVFSETITPSTITGGLLILSAGLFAMMRQPNQPEAPIRAQRAKPGSRETWE